MTSHRDSYKMGVSARQSGLRSWRWLGMEGSNLRFLIQSQASYHWTNPQRNGVARPLPVRLFARLVRRVALRVYSIL